MGSSIPFRAGRYFGLFAAEKHGDGIRSATRGWIAGADAGACTCAGDDLEAPSVPSDQADIEHAACRSELSAAPLRVAGAIRPKEGGVGQRRRLLRRATARIAIFVCVVAMIE
jgi:hypothetical protein